MDDLALRSTNQQASASGKGRVLIHEVEEEDLFEGQLAQLGHCINFLHEILVDKLILSVPLHAIVEALGDGQKFYELEEAVQGMVEGADDGLPAGEGRFIDLDLEGEGDVSVDGSNVGHHCGLCHCQE